MFRYSGNVLRNTVLLFTIVLTLSGLGMAQTAAPTSYSAYTGTDAKTIPPAPALQGANTVINDPTFGTPILRVTDANTSSGLSFISTDSGFHRTWNADSSAIKLSGPHGDGYWLEFNPSTFKVGDGSSHPVPHALPFGANWDWSAVDPNVMYILSGSQIAKYNKSTGAQTNIGGPSDGEPVAYSAVVIGQDNWICSAAGSGQQDTYTKIYCVNPSSPGTYKFIDVLNKTINGVAQGDPNWPTSASGSTIGIHDISGGTGANWLEVTFHGESWGGDGDAVLDLSTNTWSEIGSTDGYWSGHVSMGNGRYANSGGSQNGQDSRGIVLRNPDNLMNTAQFQFVGQPAITNNNWCDADHISWLNSVTNPNAPILISRYMANVANCGVELTGEIYGAATDGSGTVYRFAHNHDGGCYFGEGFAQISNDGNWALFSSYWDGTLGPDTSFGCSTRIDTFILKLTGSSTSSTTSSTTSTTSSTTSNTAPPAITTTALPAGTQNSAYTAQLSATGGTAPYSWSVASGSLPAGLSLAASTGVVSGTPTASGTSAVSIQITDAKGLKASATYNVVINAPTTSTSTSTTTTTTSSSTATASPIALVQSAKTESSGVMSVSTSFPSANTAGNLIVAFVRMSTSTQTVSLSDSLGNTYTDAVSQAQTTDGHQVHLFYAKNIRGGANTVTAAFSATNNYPWLAIYEYKGLDTVSPLDQKVSAQGSSSIISVGPSASTTAANELVFVGSAVPASYSGTIQAGAGYALALTGTSSQGADETASIATAQALSGGFVLSSSAQWSAVMASFKASGSATTTSTTTTTTTSTNTAPPAKLIQSKSMAGMATGSVSAAFPSANTAGDLIVAVVRMSTSDQTVTLRDSAGNTYAEAVGQVQSTDGHQIHIFYASKVKGSANTVTATFSATNNYPWIAVYEYSGVNTLDATAHAQGSSLSPSAGSVGLSAGAGELVISAMGLPASSSATATQPANWAMEQQDAAQNTSRSASADMIATAAGSTTGTFKLNGNTLWSAVAASFKP